LELYCSADVVIYNDLLSDKNSVIVHAQENIMPYIITKNEGDRLILDMEGCTVNAEAIKIEVYSNGFHKILHDGSGDISNVGVISSDNFIIKHDGSGNIDLNIECASLDLNQDGSGEISLTGMADEMEIDLDGSGDIEAFDFPVSEADIRSDGSGEIQVTVNESIDIKLDGSGDIEYKGNPQEIKQNNDGSGDISSED